MNAPPTARRKLGKKIWARHVVRRVRRPVLTIATMDHNVTTVNLDRSHDEPVAALQMRTLVQNCTDGVTCDRSATGSIAIPTDWPVAEQLRRSRCPRPGR
jgi:hypothetical protein